MKGKKLAIILLCCALAFSFIFSGCAVRIDVEEGTYIAENVDSEWFDHIEMTLTEAEENQRHDSNVFFKDGKYFAASFKLLKDGEEVEIKDVGTIWRRRGFRIVLDIPEMWFEVEGQIMKEKDVIYAEVRVAGLDLILIKQ